jgi:carbamoyltransferase
MKDTVNLKVKRRDPFRPFAPSVLKERAAEFFGKSGILASALPSFMLSVLPVRPAMRRIVPAVTHVDGTARLHTVDRRTDPRFHALLSAFAKITGVPVLLNTSFNVKGKPVVSSPEEALAMFAKGGLDLLVMDRFVVRRRRDG